MSEWTWPLIMGLAGGTLLFLLILVPLLVWQYRRYGHLTFRRLLGSLAVSLYAAGLFAYTMLPLPVPAELDCSGGSAIQPRPFQFLADIRKETAGLSTAGMLTSRVTLQVVFNVVLFLPWGMLVRGFFKRGWVLATVTAFLGSLLIETTQYTGLWFLYPCSYRLADVDDLIANTAGGLIGALIAPLFLAWMPASRQLASTRSLPRPVTVWRRWFAMFLDWLGIGTLATVCTVGLNMVLQVTGWARPAHGMEILLTALLPGLVWVVVPALTGTRASAGQKAVWLAPVRAGTGAGPGASGHDDAARVPGARLLSQGRALARAGAVGGVYVLVPVAQALLPATVAGLLGGLLSLWILAALISVVPTRNHRGLSFVLAGAGLVDSRTLEPTAATQRD